MRDPVVVVTGASSGIGAATAREAARRGARTVVLMARSAGPLEEVAREVRDAGARTLVVPVDLADADAVAAACQRVEQELGSPDVLVNNAGAGRWLFAEETPPAEAVQMMAAPYFAAFFTTRAFLPGMLARRSGRLAFVTSPAAYAPWPGATGYAAARWAIRGLAEALRADLHGTGVGVTLFTAGKVSSPYFAHNPGTEERMPGIARLYRTLTPEEAAAALVRAVERRSGEVVVPGLLRWTMRFQRVWPGAVAWMLTRTGASRR
jgi:NADP-dependent 3-hydroxy acid dehydrogenase YdfG